MYSVRVTYNLLSCVRKASSMAQEGKKISFGFSKVIKKSDLKPVSSVEVKKVDFINCIDNKFIKLVNEEVKEDGELVIPMLNSISVQKRIEEKINLRKAAAAKAKLSNDKALKSVTNGDEKIKIKKEPDSGEPTLSLEAQAAQEIIADLQPKVEGEDVDENLSIAPVTNVVEEKESTLDDYESIPVDKFGLALMRGMGWTADKNSSLNSASKSVDIINVRPKGLGLGADKVLSKKPSSKATGNEKELKLKKGAYVKITGAKYKNYYGQVEGCDDDSGRIIVKLALVNESISFHEALIELVTSADYTKNAKVLNASKYEKFKNRINDGEEITISSDDDDVSRQERSDQSRRKNSHGKKVSKDRVKYYSNDNSAEVNSTLKNRSNSRDRDDSHRRMKKSKKHKRENSEWSRKDSKREKERSKDYNYKSSSSRSDKKRQRKHRSRSKSQDR